MKTATSLALVAIGAILAFAITRSPSWLNFQVVGWVLMVTGAIGAVLPRRGSGWLRRSTVVETEDVAATGADSDALTETVEVRETEPGTPRFSRLLVPGRIATARRAAAVPAAGEIKQETIEEYIEE
jgi:hypothetical protein